MPARVRNRRAQRTAEATRRRAEEIRAREAALEAEARAEFDARVAAQAAGAPIEVAGGVSAPLTLADLRSRLFGGHKHPNKWTPEAREKFLAAYCVTGRLADAADAAGVTYQTLCDQRRLAKADPTRDPMLESDIEAALEVYTDSLRAEVRRRGVDGWDERPVISETTGEIVGYVHKYSDALLQLELKRRDRTYRDVVKVEQSGTVQHAHLHATVDLEKLIAAMTPEQRALIRQLKAIELPVLAAEATKSEDTKAPAEGLV